MRVSTMWRPALFRLALLVPSTSTRATGRPFARVAADPPVLGRWDITIKTPDGDRPSWLELAHSGRDVVVGRFVGIVGSARPISRVVVHGDSMHFAIPPQWENGDADRSEERRVGKECRSGGWAYHEKKN